MSTSRRRIILDCDPGRDDALAIAMALASPAEIDLAGLTAVAGNVPLELTYRNARFLRELCGFPDAPGPRGCQAARSCGSSKPRCGTTGRAASRGSRSEMAAGPIESHRAVGFMADTLRGERRPGNHPPRHRPAHQCRPARHRASRADAEGPRDRGDGRRIDGGRKRDARPRSSTSGRTRMPPRSSSTAGDRSPSTASTSPTRSWRLARARRTPGRSRRRGGPATRPPPPSRRREPRGALRPGSARRSTIRARSRGWCARNSSRTEEVPVAVETEGAHALGDRRWSTGGG